MTGTGTGHRLTVFRRPFVKRFAVCYRTVVCMSVLSCLSVTLVYCGQMAGWIKIPLSMFEGLGPGDFVLDEDPAPALQKRCRAPSPIFGPCPLWPNGWIDQDDTWHRGVPWSRHHCARLGPSSPSQKRGGAPSQFSAHFYCGQTAGCIKMPVGMEVGLSPGEFVRWGPSPSPKRGRSPFPNFKG